MVSILLLIALSWTCFGQTPLPNVEYFGYGINLLLVDVFDPLGSGQFMHSVYQLSYSTNTTTADGKWLVPDNTSALPYSQCGFVSLSQTVTNTFDYYKYVSYSVSESDSFLSYFSSSESYSYAQWDWTSSSMDYVYLGAADCKAYSISLVPYTVPLLTSAFAQGVATLPIQFKSLDDYSYFFSQFGTHLLSGPLLMGGRMTQNSRVTAVDVSYLNSQGISASAEASVGFQVSVGVDANGQENTTQYLTYTKYAQVEALSVLGGTATVPWYDWAPTVLTNPVPIGFGVQTLATLLTPQFFPTDSDILARQNALALATEAYLSTNGRAPEYFIADVVDPSTSMNHQTQLEHGAGGIPTYIHLEWTQSPNRNESTFFPILTANEDSTTGQPTSPYMNDQLISIPVSSSFGFINGHFDESSNRWTKDTQGFWVTTAMAQPPRWGGNWIYVSNAVGQSVILASKVASNWTLIQLQFAELPNPLTVYPLLYRCVTSSGAQQTNPTGVYVADGNVYMQFSKESTIFQTWTNYKWTSYSSGYFRANVFDLVPDYDSGFVESIKPPNKQLFFHGLVSAPRIVEVFFRPLASDVVYPVLNNPAYGTTMRNWNPVTISVDSGQVVLNLQDANLWQVITPDTNVVTAFTSGSWRVIAWKITPTP